MLIHGALNKKERPPEIMAPHSGVGGCTPTPKKLSPAPMSMHISMSDTAYTIAPEITLGRMWRNRMRIWE